MNTFEQLLLKVTKAVAVAAPAIAPIFIHSQKGVLIFNASDELTQALTDQFVPVTN